MKKLIRRQLFSKKEKRSTVPVSENLPNSTRTTPIGCQNDTTFSWRLMRPKRALSALVEIPLEIWAIIFSYLRQGPLGALSRTCHTVHAITEPFLYRDIELYWSNYRPRVYFLLRTLIERPGLGLHVRSLRLWCSSSFRYLPTCDLGSSVDISIHAAYIRSMGFEPAEMWDEAASHVNTEAIAALIFSLVPNVQGLCFSKYFVENPNFVASVFRQAASENNPWRSEEDIQPFAKLRSVKITTGVIEQHPGKWDRLDVGNLSEYVRLPALRELESAIPAALVVALSDYRAVWPLKELTCHCLGSDYLAQLLSFTPYLEVLDYTHPWPEESTFNCISLHKALLNVKDSLIDLAIKCGYDSEHGTHRHWWPTQHGYGVEGTFGSLRAFGKLRNLYIPWILLTVRRSPDLTKIVDVLPSNLRMLTLGDELATYIYGPGSDTGSMTRNAQLRDFLCVWRECTTELGRISVKGSWDFWKPDAVEDMKKMCRTATIDLVFIK